MSHANARQAGITASEADRPSLTRSPEGMLIRGETRCDRRGTRQRNRGIDGLGLSVRLGRFCAVDRGRDASDAWRRSAGRSDDFLESWVAETSKASEDVIHEGQHGAIRVLMDLWAWPDLFGLRQVDDMFVQRLLAVLKRGRPEGETCRAQRLI